MPIIVMTKNFKEYFFMWKYKHKNLSFPNFLQQKKESTKKSSEKAFSKRSPTQAFQVSMHLLVTKF